MSTLGGLSPRMLKMPANKYVEINIIYLYYIYESYVEFIGTQIPLPSLITHACLFIYIFVSIPPSYIRSHCTT